MTQPQKLDQETRLLAAMAYGEASADDIEEEMKALASVLVRQRNARGYASMTSFTSTDKTFSFVSQGKIISEETVEVGRYDHIYVSTAAFGGTIFWKNNEEYMSVTRAKAHK